MSDLRSLFNKWSAKYVVVIIELLILRLLDKKEMYGVIMLERIREQLGTDVKRTTVYAILKRYENEYLIEVTREESGENTRGSTRKYFRLTASGKSLLSDMIELQERFCQDKLGGNNNV